MKKLLIHWAGDTRDNAYCGSTAVAIHTTEHVTCPGCLKGVARKAKGARVFLGRYRTPEEILARILAAPEWKGAKVKKTEEFFLVTLGSAELRLRRKP